MRLNHLDLQVSDVHAARAFFETHFGLRCTYARGDQIAIFTDETGFAFGVSNLFRHRGTPLYPPDFHVGFILENAAQVEDAYHRLRAADVETVSEPRIGGTHLYFVCLGPDGIRVEVSGPREA